MVKMEKEYTLRYVFKILFGWGAKKALDISTHKELNGIYYYDKDLILINLCSNDIHGLNTDMCKITKIGNVITHELIHRTIYDITNKVANQTEEDFIDVMMEVEV